LNNLLLVDFPDYNLNRPGESLTNCYP